MEAKCGASLFCRLFPTRFHLLALSGEPGNQSCQVVLDAREEALGSYLTLWHQKSASGAVQIAHVCALRIKPCAFWSLEAQGLPPVRSSHPGWRRWCEEERLSASQELISCNKAGGLVSKVNLSSPFDLTSANLAFLPPSVIASELDFIMTITCRAAPCTPSHAKAASSQSQRKPERRLEWREWRKVERATFAHSPSTHGPLEVQLGSSHKEPTHAQCTGFFLFKLSQPGCLAQTLSALTGPEREQRAQCSARSSLQYQ